MFRSAIYHKITSRTIVMVVGMHRSGTGLLSEILQRLGVFMGKELSANKESLFFQGINKDLLDINGCNWKHISDLSLSDNLLQENKWMLKYIGSILQSRLAIEHFGIKKNCLFFKIPDVWGWKDPRNSLLIPIWKEMFPKIRILNILRDGRDVALSLTNRDIKRYKYNKKCNHDWIKDTYLTYFNLWEDYVLRITKSLENEANKYCLTYENLLRYPEAEINSIIEYLGVSKKSLNNACSIVDTGKLRTDRYERLPYLKDVDISKNYLKKLGFF